MAETHCPLLTPISRGGTTIDFDAFNTGFYQPLQGTNAPGVVITASLPRTASPPALYVGSNLLDGFNTSGKSVQLFVQENNNPNTVYAQSVTFAFQNPVDAFGLNIGGTDQQADWDLIAYSATNNVLDSQVPPA